jgi:hypothetical protein
MVLPLIIDLRDLAWSLRIEALTSEQAAGIRTHSSVTWGRWRDREKSQSGGLSERIMKCACAGRGGVGLEQKQVWGTLVHSPGWSGTDDFHDGLLFLELDVKYRRDETWPLIGQWHYVAVPDKISPIVDHPSGQL